ncbi:30S ribosomal protein S6 [Campylobacter sp. FMV-PI01]|uniref:Small ribosomal subunit protein bS6 n=1 Tax=Campylobacter portucalensis TaxID=2608384 RepID=A0A6L5WL39_9BACT|nr:30S ribosomal protein S6 [Campylobacter portucalensis]MSN96725.1 30S ribosomal protein S6 [Campylobacter portucalensis]
MKHYEVLFIVKPTLTDEEVKKRVDFVKEIITKNGGEVASVIEMGTRKLAYSIKKYERGVYFVVYFIAPTALISELVRNIRYNEDIIRFLTVKYENKKEILAWEKLSKGMKFGISKKERKPRANIQSNETKDSNEDSNIEA